MRSKILIALTAFLSLLSFQSIAVPQRDQLAAILGEFPDSPQLNVSVLETTPIEGGNRKLIEYIVEDADSTFGRPIDKVKAYLFVPNHKAGERLPAVVAIHQDGPNTHIGKSEPAGLRGAEDQHFGLELFQRGYVVICPDRYYHAERRRIPDAANAPSVMMRDLGLWLKWAGQLILSGRTHFGKETYDLMRAVDVLMTLEAVDPDRIGAIGHSAGGNVLVYFMFMDQRVKVGVSSCGFYELLDDFNDQNSSFSNSVFALPGLSKIGRSADYLADIAPRPLLMTRGLEELSNEKANRDHVGATRRIEAYARNRYGQVKAFDRLRVIYFEGGHEFPNKVRIQAYEWIDTYLKR